MRTITLTLLLVLAVALCATAQGTYTQIDPPGAIVTNCFGINSAGTVVGTYTDSSLALHGFLFSDGVYTTIDEPGNHATYAYGINNNDQIVGMGDVEGFVYDLGTHTFTTLYYPGSSQTTPLSINDAGVIAGLIGVLHGNVTYEIAFRLQGGAYSLILPPDYITSAAYSINNSDQVVVTAYQHRTMTNFLVHGSKHRVLDVLAPHPVVTGINDLGDLVGFAITPSGLGMGFLSTSGTLQRLAFPGSPGFTQALGVNNTDEVVGVFSDSAGVQHGFLWTPPAPKGH